MSQVDITKQYRTRSGKEVQIYAIHKGQDFSVHGAYYCNGRWIVDTWKTDGRSGYIDTDRDLVEVKPRVKGTTFINVGKDGTLWTFHTLDAAKRYAPKGIFARVKIDIDVEEGEGLND